MVRPKDVCIAVYSVGVISPLVFLGESSHVVSNTHDFLLRQLHVLTQEKNRFIAVTLEIGVGTVLIAGRFTHGVGFAVVNTVLDRKSVV